MNQCSAELDHFRLPTAGRIDRHNCGPIYATSKRNVKILVIAPRLSSRTLKMCIVAEYTATSMRKFAFFERKIQAKKP